MTCPVGLAPKATRLPCFRHCATDVLRAERIGITGRQFFFHLRHASNGSLRSNVPAHVYLLSPRYRSPKVSKPPLAKPFFDQSSIVLDFYKGHLGAVIERVTEADFSFVMYYAPWDAESQAVRQEFEKVAQYYDTQVRGIVIKPSG